LGSGLPDLIRVRAPARAGDHPRAADRAAKEARELFDDGEAFPELGIQGRIGVTTGEVVTGTEERLATGDAVNIAARLEQAAPERRQVVVLEPARAQPPKSTTRRSEHVAALGWGGRSRRSEPRMRCAASFASGEIAQDCQRP